jgi:ABC-type antimicrobial peptide transport system permease subunit
VDSWAIAGNQSFPNSSSWSGTQVFADTASLHREEGYVHAQSYSFVALDGSNLLRTYGMKDARTGGDIRLPEQVEDKAFISERLALLLFGTADAVGKKVYQSDEPLEVAGVFRDFKHRDYEQPYPLIVTMYSEMYGSQYMPWWYNFVIRLKPGVDVSAFKQRFQQEVAPQLSVGNFYFDSLKEFSELSEDYAMKSGVTNKLRLQYALTGFALLCIFLGMVGTFWIRSNARRGEIGVMRSMGASQGCIVRQFLIEAWLLLTVAFVLVIPFLLYHAYTSGLYMVEMGSYFVPNPAYGQNRFGFHFTVVLALSYLVLVLIALVGTYIPVRRAARALPVEALREE